MATALHAFEQGVNLFIGQRVGAPELRMEVGGILWNIGERIVDLVVTMISLAAILVMVIRQRLRNGISQ